MAKPGARTRIQGFETLAQGARLAQRLISSLDQEVDVHAEKLWLQEANRRLDELKSGKVAGIPAEKVIRKARSTLR